MPIIFMLALYNAKTYRIESVKGNCESITESDIRLKNNLKTALTILSCANRRVKPQIIL